MLKKTLLFAALSFTMLSVNAQDQKEPLSNDSLTKAVASLKHDLDLLKNLKVGGWIQGQFQWADSNGVKNFDGGDFPANSDKRFMIRRGRIKFTYTQKNSQYVLQINATERGINLTDFYGKVTDPWTKAVSLTVGVMNRPFGFEIQQSSADRETPERSRFTQTLMPNERDMGAMLTFQPVKGKKLYGLKIDAGMYNGTGIAVPGTTSNVNGFTDFDYIKDFIGRIAYTCTTKNDKIRWGIGASHYNGGVIRQNNVSYSTIINSTEGYKVYVASDTSNKIYKGKIAPRVYYGGDFQFSVNSVIGTTSIRGEYITGTQPGTKMETKSPATLPASQDMYLRSFNGGYAYFIQRIGKSKHELAVKYEWYDPNTKITGADLNGKNGMTQAEIKYTMLGLGYVMYWDANIKFMAYYNMVTNEKTGISGYTRDLKDNILTLRMQYKF
jgi:phosphate-selective porin